MQRSSAESARARASSAGSASISSGCTASAGAAQAEHEQQRRAMTRRSAAHSAGASDLRGIRAGARRADAQPAVGQRQRAAEHHDQRAEPDQRDQRLPLDAHDDRPSIAECRRATRRAGEPERLDAASVVGIWRAG